MVRQLTPHFEKQVDKQYNNVYFYTHQEVYCAHKCRHR